MLRSRPRAYPRFPGDTSVRWQKRDGLGWVVRTVGLLYSVGHSLDSILDTPLDALFILRAGVLAANEAEERGIAYEDRGLGAGTGEFTGSPEGEKNEKQNHAEGGFGNSNADHNTNNETQ